MMKIYIDLVIILNFVLDLILLMSVNFILRRNSKLWRLILGSFMGNITIILLFIRINNIVFVLSKLVCSLVIILVAFGYKDIKYVIKNIFLLLINR